jgi:hypothetical protein
MKQMIITFMLLAGSLVHASDNDSSTGQTNRVEKVETSDFLFHDVNACAQVSDHYKQIALGSSLTDIHILKDTPIPNGLYWPEYRQADGSVIAGLCLSPPTGWGSNYIVRTDGESRKQFFFFHDGRKVIRIVWTALRLTTAVPQGPSPTGLELTTYPEPVGPLITMDEDR